MKMASFICRAITRGHTSNRGVQLLAARFMSGHETRPAEPVNAPPNDHLSFRVTTLDDLPEPQGNWLEDYKKKQLKYWRHFFMGLFALSGTLYYIYAYEPIFFNFHLVELPPKEERLKTFWQPPAYLEEDED